MTFQVALLDSALYFLGLSIVFIGIFFLLGNESNPGTVLEKATTYSNSTGGHCVAV